ncbi:MAG: phospholipid-binding protein MlaC [Kiloniellales bacterium]
MRPFLFALACLFFAAAPTASTSFADEASDGAVAFVQSLSSEVLQTVQGDKLTAEQRDAKLRGLFERGLDLAGIGRFVLGRHWSDATEEQIDEYQTLFTAYLLGTTTRLMNRHEVKGLTVIAANRAEGGDVIVQSRLLIANGKPLEWAWRIRDVGGELRVVDLQQDGVSMAATYRSEFGSVAANQGLDGLLQALRSRTQVRSANAA